MRFLFQSQWNVKEIEAAWNMQTTDIRDCPRTPSAECAKDFKNKDYLNFTFSLLCPLTITTIM